MSFHLFVNIASWVWKRRAVVASGFVIVALIVAYALGRRSVKPVQLAGEKIVGATEHVPYGVPQPYPVYLPGTHTKEVITVERTRDVEGKERIVTVTPAVPCKDEEECRRIFGAAEQRITINAAIRQGTVVPVLTPQGEAAYPLARDFPFEMRLVMSERGVFHALDLPNFPVKPITVKTETLIVSATPKRELPYHLGFTAGVIGAQTYAGVVYQNYIGPVIYQVTAGYGFPGPVYGLSFTLPLR